MSHKKKLQPKNIISDIFPFNHKGYTWIHSCFYVHPCGLYSWQRLAIKNKHNKTCVEHLSVNKNINIYINKGLYWLCVLKEKFDFFHAKCFTLTEISRTQRTSLLVQVGLGAILQLYLHPSMQSASDSRSLLSQTCRVRLVALPLKRLAARITPHDIFVIIQSWL